MARGNQNLALYVLVAAETFHTAPQFLPDLDTLAREDFDAHVRVVRRGEILGAAWSLLIAVVIAHATNSATPMAIWLATIAATVALYEFHLRKAPDATD